MPPHPLPAPPPPPPFSQVAGLIDYVFEPLSNRGFFFSTLCDLEATQHLLYHPLVRGWKEDHVGAGLPCHPLMCGWGGAMLAPVCPATP
jgi:hypothetical protein